MEPIGKEMVIHHENKSCYIHITFKIKDGVSCFYE